VGVGVDLPHDLPGKAVCLEADEGELGQSWVEDVPLELDLLDGAIMGDAL